MFSRKQGRGNFAVTPQAEDETLSGEELVIKAGDSGQFTYFCSVRGHAKGGMWGNIIVGVKPDANMKMPEKTEHIHSTDEDKAPIKQVIIKQTIIRGTRRRAA